MEEIVISLIAGVGIAISTSLLGVFIFWKKMAYFGDAMSHASLLGIGFAVISPLMPATGILIMSIIFALLVYFLSKIKSYSHDTIIAITSYGLMAFGLILIALFKNEIDLESYLFGELNLVSIREITFIYLNSAAVLLFVGCYFKKLLLTKINEDIAIISSINTKILNLIFLLLTAITIAILVKMVGVFLVTALLIIPAAAARNLSSSPTQMTITTLIISLISVFFGIYFSSLLNIPAAPAVIATAICLLIFTLTLRKIS